ncbi:ABC transporter ATP-binding protein [Corynebacterium sp. TAE3-ERU2]|uniref:ABC transporter ATP-binding protein n=1 Tax=Corynebacterium sp. TAE3-ERU2 TaxID=2849497 RepID=UPI001C493C3E|nr:ABC transporter ATP-binding protein [Corynebacterium sp. TAE3-ERU2]MBV7301032.1 ABC transporter ATP-binding protein [Corynebacterium sp. TAE3-ERU2]
MIELRNVSMSYGRKSAEPVLRELNLTIPEGELVLLCGESGCGKSSLLRLINGVAHSFCDAQISGEILLDGELITHAEPHDIAQYVGSVFQNPKSQFFTLEVISELAFGCENLGIAPEEIRRRIGEVTDKFSMSHLIDRQLFALSGGQKQKVACASVAAMQPQVLLLDEPSSNLDLKAIDELHDIVARWKKQGRTLLVAEHRLSYLADIVDRVLVMRSGQIAQEFSGDQFRDMSDEELHEIGLRSSRPVPEVVDEPRLVEHTMTLDKLRFTYPKASVPALNIDQAELPTAQIIGVVGRNGAGKSTFVRALTGIEPRAKGALHVGGRKLSSPRQRLRHSYLVMQDVNHQLFGESVDADAMIGTGSMSAEEQDHLTEVLSELDLADKREQHPMSLSGGERQRVAIASALLSQRELLVFDEPTSGLDLRRMRHVAQLLDNLARQGKTVLVVTHDVELLARCCDSLLLIDGGKVSTIEACDSTSLERTVRFLRGDEH